MGRCRRRAAEVARSRVAFEFIPGTDSVIVLDLEKPLAVLDVATGEVIREIDLPDDVEYFALEIDPTGRMVALIAPRGRRVDVIDVASGDIEKSLKLPGPQRGVRP